MGTTIRIQGMRCQHCAATVEKVLSSLGAHRVQVDVVRGEAHFEGTVERDLLRAAIAAKGFVLAD